jgi:hypothetical protein
MRRLSLTECDYSRDLRLAEWGQTVILRGNNYRNRMSALGQKRTCARVKAMSAYPKSGHSTPFVRLPCHHTRWPRFHDPNPKAYSIGHLAMRLMLSCRAVNRIAAQTYKPTFFMSFRRLPEKDKIHVVTDLGLHSSLGAIWACDAGTILLERP